MEPALIAAIERMERAQMETLAIQLFHEDRRVGMINRARWGGQLPEVRDRFRAEAHMIMQGLEPVGWGPAKFNETGRPALVAIKEA